MRTIFNFLGPLTNPAGATRQLIGVSDPAYLETMAGALALLGTKHALLVSSEDGLDELSISAPTQVVEVTGGELHLATRCSPEDVGLERGRRPSEVPGGDPERRTPRPRGRSSPVSRAGARDLAALNAGAAICAGGRAQALVDGVSSAQTAIDTGAAAAGARALRAGGTRELAP